MPLDGEWARADVLRVLRDACPNDRLDWAHIAKVYNFDLQALDDPQGIVPITAWHGTFEYVAKSLNDDAIMFDIFNELDVGSFSIFDYVFACAPSLRDACQAWVRFIQIRTNAYRIKFEETETGAFIEWPSLEGRGEWRQNMFARIGWAARQLEHALDMNVPPILIEIATYPPEMASAFQKKYQGRIQFRAPTNRISLPKALLNRPLRRQDPHLYQIILKSALQELDEFGQMVSPISRLANEIAASLSEGGAALPKIAAKIGMSQRAIQRLLAKEGTTYRQLNEEIRKSAAERYLRSTDLPMKEIAFLLGFSELSTFSRAVKLWFGESPRKVRERLAACRTQSAEEDAELETALSSVVPPDPLVKPN